VVSPMIAAVVHAAGGPEVLRIEELPVRESRPGWVLVRVRAFGLNRSELVTRAGGAADAVKFPRVLGIECVGEMVEAPDAGPSPGQTIVGAMRGMGRDWRLGRRSGRRRGRAAAGQALQPSPPRRSPTTPTSVLVQGDAGRKAALDVENAILESRQQR
jgi:NADPH:quinone reductase-like Zn-dependent oxidoreductase